MLMHTGIMGAPQHIILPFYVFQYGRELEHFPRGRKKYNKTNNIMKLVDKASDRDGDWERMFLKTGLFFSIGRFGSILITLQKNR